MSAPLMSLESVSFRYRGTSTPALEEFGITLDPGRSIGVVGESGSGKTTAMSLILALNRPTGGAVSFEGEPLRHRDRRQLRRLRKAVQPVFQNPYASLDPRMRVDRIVSEPLSSLGLEESSPARRARVVQVLEEVGLGHDTLSRYPHEFSGGQRQRIAIARALVTMPRVLVADEPVSALDVTTRIEVVRLLDRLRKDHRLGLVMVSHDMSVVAALCDEVMVLKDGRIVEQGPTRALLDDPQEAYTQELIGSIPRLA